jgi:AraC-like DNA-binding protein
LIIKANLLRAVAICSRYELLSRQAAPRTGSRLQYRTQTLRAILAYLDAHYTEKLSLSVLAHEFGMTPGYFCTFFRDCFGRTFIQHLNLLRIERASRLLRETDLPVMEIAFSVGFEHFSYFIKRFRDVFGCTPTVYRKSVDLAAEGGA